MCLAAVKKVESVWEQLIIKLGLLWNQPHDGMFNPQIILLKMCFAVMEECPNS